MNKYKVNLIYSESNININEILIKSLINELKTMNYEDFVASNIPHDLGDID